MSQPLDATGRIVVGADLTRTADHALDWAADRAASRGEPLLILMVGPESEVPRHTLPHHVVSTAESEAALRDRAAERLLELADRVRQNHPHLEVETRVVDGRVSPVMAEVSLTATMVVLGSRGETAPLSVRLLGGTSDAVASQSRCPVAIIRSDRPTPTSGPVVVGIDDSAAAMAAVSFAVDEAVAMGAGLVGVHVWDSTAALLAGTGLWGSDGSQVGAGLEAMVDQLMEPFLAGHPDLHYRTMIVPGRASSVLADLSDEASLVVIGSRHRNPFAGLLLSTTSRGVPRESGCPVVLVRP